MISSKEQLWNLLQFKTISIVYGITQNLNKSNLHNAEEENSFEVKFFSFFIILHFIIVMWISTERPESKISLPYNLS